MALLAIDTTAEACKALVHDKGRVIGVCREEMARGHGDRVLPVIEAALTRAGLDFAGLDRFAVLTGPGSFTGVRVGVAAARALGLALGCPVLGIDGYAVLCAQAREAFSLQVGSVIRIGFGRPSSPVLRDFLRTDDGFVAIAPRGCVDHEIGPAFEQAALREPDLETLCEIVAGISDPAQHPAKPCYLRAPDAEPGKFTLRSKLLPDG
ncbi:MAG: tRNA (adenosine(37)-N6)-threonylcarbamoyltransferase complex dimerization subunit type 1 TsaB [Neomegalonema sp.]|nr:tRNA (adenosine(37)-N6)-threonylcarbamoyltransferase complex dimerization subunit type 1 TsaB [Neomegalonema sp.]